MSSIFFIKRIILNKAFWLSVAIACLLLLCSVVYTDIDSGQQYLFISLFYDKVSMEALEYGFISLGDIFWGYDSSYLWMFCPIILGIPCVIVKKTERFALFRTTKNKYFLSKYFSAIIAGGAILFFAYLIFGLMCNWMSKESILNIYFVKKLLSVFVWGVTVSVPATILSEFVRSKYLILCIPFVINYFLNIFLYRFIPESIREYVMPDSFIILFLREDRAIKGCLIYTVIIVFSCALMKKIIAERRCDCGC